MSPSFVVRTPYQAQSALRRKGCQFFQKKRHRAGVQIPALCSVSILIPAFGRVKGGGVQHPLKKHVRKSKKSWLLVTPFWL